jgi:hypothetical protein
MRVEKVTDFIIIEDGNGDEVLIDPHHLDELITKLIAIPTQRGVMSVHWVEARFSYQEAGVAIDEHGAKVSEWLNSLEEEYIILDFKMTVAENGNTFCLAKVDARDWSP